MNDRVLEIRTYRVRNREVDAFVELMRREALPLLAAAEIDVVACGASHDPGDGEPRDAYLMRAFIHERQRQEAENSFYSGAVWRDGPREAVLALIDSFHTVVTTVPAAAIEALREIK